jgi:hypothetical protein
MTRPLKLLLPLIDRFCHSGVETLPKYEENPSAILEIDQK